MSLLHPLIGQPVDLTGRVALVAGATGLVGSGVAEALLRAGASVVVSSRSERRLQALQAWLKRQVGRRAERVAALVAAVGDPVDAARVLRVTLQRFGALDAVADALGPSSQVGPLSRVPPAAWRGAVDDGLTARFVLARTLLPALADRPGASYTLTACYAGLRPDPQSGARSAVMAGALMMHRTLAEEYAGCAMRFNAVVLGPVARVSPLPRFGAFPNDLLQPPPEAPPDLLPSAFPARPADAWLTPPDVGAFIALLASEAGAVVSGETIRLLDRSQLRTWMGT